MKQYNISVAEYTTEKELYEILHDEIKIMARRNIALEKSRQNSCLEHV